MRRRAHLVSGPGSVLHRRLRIPGTARTPRVDPLYEAAPDAVRLPVLFDSVHSAVEVSCFGGGPPNEPCSPSDPLLVALALLGTCPYWNPSWRKTSASPRLPPGPWCDDDLYTLLGIPAKLCSNGPFYPFIPVYSRGCDLRRLLAAVGLALGQVDLAVAGVDRRHLVRHRGLRLIGSEPPSAVHPLQHLHGRILPEPHGVRRPCETGRVFWRTRRFTAFAFA